MRPLIALALLLSACTAQPQGEHAAAPDRCGAMDAMGVIGYPISQVHPYGADRTIHVSESGYAGKHPYDHAIAPRGYGGAAHAKEVHVPYGHAAHRTEKGPIRVKPHRFTDVKTLWLGDPYRMNVYVNGHGIIVDVVCH